MTNKSASTFTGFMLMLAAFVVPMLMAGDVRAADYTLNVAIDDATLDFNAAATQVGRFVKSNKSKISVSTTNATGYTLSIAAKNTTNPTALISSSDNNKTINSISEATTEEQFKSLTGLSYNGKWGYLPSKWNAEDNTDFLPSPDTNGDILDVTETANSAVNEYELAIGARVDTTVALGSYSNVYVVYAAANPTPYTITYFDNVISNFPTDVQSTTMADSVAISSNTPYRKGYAFLGWCTVAPTTNPSGVDSCSGTTYAAGSNFAISQTSGSNNLVLYAMWQVSLCNPSGTTIDTISCMQDITSSNKSSVLASMTTDKQYQLIDKRDKKTYWVSKLKDGNVWMTQNLDLDLSVGVKLTSETSDLTAYGSGAYTTSQGYAKSGNTITWTPVRNTMNMITDSSTAISTISGWENSQTSPWSVDPGEWYWSGNYYASTNCPSTSENNYLGCNYITKNPSQYSTYFSTSPYSLNGTHGHVGNYYNWTSAIATNDSSTYTTSTYANTGASPANSICPAGWRLPKITAYTAGSLGTNEFYNLDYYYNNGATNTDAGLIAAPLFFTRSGNVWTSALHYAGYYGVYWSSTVESSTNARVLYFGSGGVYPVSSNNRNDGKSVRCLVR